MREREERVGDVHFIKFESDDNVTLFEFIIPLTLFNLRQAADRVLEIYEELSLEHFKKHVDFFVCERRNESSNHSSYV